MYSQKDWKAKKFKCKMTKVPKQIITNMIRSYMPDGEEP
jgi:hypothetical protein